MDEQTVSFDELVDLEWPINLRRVAKEPFLFYLAGKVPVSVSDLASECSQDENQITKILNRRFENKIQTDQTGFLTLTDAARSPVVSYGKQFISQAKDESNRAAELRDDEQIEAASARYYHAAELLAGVRERFAAVNYVPEQLDASVERLEENADKLRKEHAKDVYKHRNLLSKQREEDGDEAFQNGKFAVAETKFQEAHEALQDALDTVSAYNENRLSGDSPRLRTDSLEDRLDALQRKYTYASENQSAETTDSTQPESATADDAADGRSATEPDSDTPSKQALLDAIEALARQLEKAPTTTEMKEQGRFEPHQYYNAFGAWKEALEQTDLNVQADLISDLRRVADELDKRPTPSNLDEHGRYDGHWYGKYFETWEDALDAADIEDPTDEDLIAEIQRLDREHERIPSPNLLRDDGKYSPRLVRDQFGSWGVAIEAAGIDKRQRLIDELNRVNAACDGRPTTTIANDISIYSPTYFSNEFGSWGDALAAAGITADTVSEATSTSDPLSDDSTADSDEPTDEELLEEVRRLDRESGKVPTRNDMRDQGRFGEKLYYERFGTWDAVLEATGIDKRQRLIDELRRIDAECEGQPKSTLIEEVSKYSSGYFVNTFGTWEAALAAAGITDESDAEAESDATEDAASTDDDEPTDEELLEEIHRLDREYERIPLTTRMRDDGKYSPHRYYNRFGSWDDALEAAGIDKRERLVQELKRLGEQCDGRLRSTFFEEHSDYGSGYIVNEFGSWDEALAAAGLSHESHNETSSRPSTTDESGDDDSPTEDDLIQELNRLVRSHDTALTPSIMQSEGEYSPDRYAEHFGSWDEALEAAGIGTDTEPTRDALIADLQRLDAESDDEPTPTTVKFHGKYDSADYRAQFNGWDAALEAAGISDQSAAEAYSTPTADESDSPSPDSDSSSPSSGSHSSGSTADTGRTSNDDLIEELHRLDGNMSGTPTGNTMMTDGKYNTSLYYMRFGSWDDALEAAGITSDTGSDRSSTTTESETSQETGRTIIHPNQLAELYESLRVLNKVLIEYIEATPNLQLGVDEPIANWQSAIEDVAVGDGINLDVPCLGQLHADRNPFSMSEYREHYGDGDRVTDFQALAVAELGTREYDQLVAVAGSSLPKPRLPIVPGSGERLPTLPSNSSDLDQALTLLEKLLTATIDVDTVAPPALSATQTDTESATISGPTTPTETDSGPDPLTLADIEPSETYEGPLVGRLTGYIANPSGDAKSQLHFEDTVGEDFWLYITDQDVDHEWEKGNWYFLSMVRGPEELGGGRGDQALRSTPQLSVEDHGTSLPPTIDAAVSGHADSRAQSPSSTRTTSTTTSSDGQTTTTSSDSQTASSSASAGSSSSDDHSDSEPDEDTDPMVDDLLEDMEENDLL